MLVFILFGIMIGLLLDIVVEERFWLAVGCCVCVWFLMFEIVARDWRGCRHADPSPLSLSWSAKEVYAVYLTAATIASWADEQRFKSNDGEALNRTTLECRAEESHVVQRSEGSTMTISSNAFFGLSLCARASNVHYSPKASLNTTART